MKKEQDVLGGNGSHLGAYMRRQKDELYIPAYHTSDGMRLAGAN
jgi:hypothetical protein